VFTSNHSSEDFGENRREEGRRGGQSERRAERREGERV
jgi:hypothetical protein